MAFDIGIFRKLSVSAYPGKGRLHSLYCRVDRYGKYGNRNIRTEMSGYRRRSQLHLPDHRVYGVRLDFRGFGHRPCFDSKCQKIVTCNPVLVHRIELRLQKDRRNIFEGVILPDDFFDVTICNPPFHSSKEEAEKGTLRKLSSLKGKKVSKAQLNFGGNANELWCEGGELRFLLNMITESRKFRKTANGSPAWYLKRKIWISYTPNSNQPVLPNIERYKCNKAQKQPDIGLAVLANKLFFFRAGYQ